MKSGPKSRTTKPQLPGQSDLIQSVVAAVDILSALERNPDAMPLADLARQISMPAPRVFRHLATLTALGLVERSGDEPTYRLGWRLAQLGDQAARQHDFSRSAQPHLAELQRRVGQAVVIARTNGDNDPVIWMSLPSLDVPHLMVPLGTQVSPLTTATGRVLLAFAPEAQRTRILQRLKKEWKNTPAPSFPLDGPGASKELELVRKRMYALRRSETTTTIAAPIFNHRNEGIAAIAVIGLFQSDKSIAAMVPELLTVAESLSTELGGATNWLARTDR